MKITPPEKTEITWQTPLPLIENNITQNLYPIDALPNIIKEPILSYQSYGQQPISLIACGALANISLACQTLANVARDHLLISPVSLYFLVVANSGERKSAADKAFGLAIRQWQTTNREHIMPDVVANSIIHQSWSAERDSLVRQIRKAKSNGESSLYLESQLKELIIDEPSVPLLPDLFFEDTTQEALTNALAHGWPSSSLWSDEGSIVLAGHGMHGNTTKFIATLNRMWDGNPFIIHRKTSKSFTVSNRRLTVSLMLQSLLLEQMLAKSGGVIRQSGFLARSLIAKPVSSMGNRYYQTPPESLAGLANFHARITDCLNQSLSLDINGCHDLPTLVFSKTAKTKWISHFNKIEGGISKASHWLSIQDFASKAAENIARLAALLHLFQGKTGEISSETTEQAISIIDWHLHETKRIFEPTTPYNNHNQDATKLLKWLKNKELSETTPRHIQQFGPIRDKVKRDKAIGILIDNYYIAESTVNNKITMVLNPAAFN